MNKEQREKFEKQIAQEKRITDLEKEKCELLGIIQGKDKVIAELKADNDARKFAMAMSEKVEKQLREENAELKEKLNIRSCQNCRNYNRTCPNDGSCKNYSKWESYKNPQLTKAKEIIHKFCYEYGIYDKDFVEETKQFLSEVE